ncbi:MAG: hypothetical protein JXJ20_10945 [Anaerolineae bacterium]|nr:hypothetical protein [Anaerolineae bacterium]
MPITVQWDDDDHKAVRWEFEGDWNWYEYQAAQAQSNALIDTVDHVVDVIAVMQNTRDLPREAFDNYRRLEKTSHPNRGRIVIVGSDTFIRSMLETFNQVYKRGSSGFILVRSIQEAHEVLARD